MLIVFSISLVLDARDARQNFGFSSVRSFFASLIAPRIPGSRHASFSMQHMLRHRPAAATTRHFATGPWVIAVITDLDKESCRVQDSPEAPMRLSSCGKANTWISYYKRGVLKIDGSPSPKLLSTRRTKATVEWLDELKLVGHGHFEIEREGHHPYGGRGMELSELEWFFGHLLTPDDRTGMLLEIMSPRGQLDQRTYREFLGESSKVAPSTFHRATLLDGSGNDTSAFFKSEWMVVKDDKLIIGGHGRSYTDPADGTRIKSDNPKWVKVVDKDFKVSHVNWSSQYDALARAAGVPFPGYLMHEAVLWSNERSEWVFLPRRKSTDAYDSAKNDRRGTNIAITASGDFRTIKVVEIKGLEDRYGQKGFSSAKFVPGTRDGLIVAVRTVEIEENQGTSRRRETASFLSVFEVSTGMILMPELKFSSKKFEGLVFL